jgi:iron complex outermembrane receptor protein
MVRKALRRRVLLLSALAACPVDAQQPARNLADMSLDQLSSIQVVSVSRRTEPLSDAAASIYVISAEDIRRSGAQTLPEVLRLAPNLQVARADANQYAISARGFNSVLANKMLVMIDGRVVYSPLFSGVFWEAQDVMLADVLRIEVISGPGATQYGSNAVNGIINILTRPASQTQGTLATAGIGNRHKDVALRRGGELESGGHYRVYGKWSERGNTVLGNGTPVRDGSNMGQAGFRVDWTNKERDFTLQGDAYSSDIDQAPSARKLSGMNLRARWTGQLTEKSRARFQVYYDRVERDQPGTIREQLDTVHAEFQHESRPWERHLLTWGGDYRHATDAVENLNPAALGFNPPTRRLERTSIFAQDSISLRPDLTLTLGVKVERNEYTGNEYLPSARIAWKLDDRRLIWGALSRAVRAPSRVDREFTIPANRPFLLAGGPDFQSETVKVMEVGYRAQPSERVSYSMSTYRQHYDHLRTTEPRAGGAVFLNNIAGHTDGLEFWGNLRATQSWRLSAGQVMQWKKLALKPGSLDAAGVAALGNDPRNTTTLRSSHDLGLSQELDIMVRHVGSLPNGPVPSYTAMDLRWGWWAQRNVEFSVTGQNLFDRRHPEWGVPAARVELERAVFFRIAWHL